MIGLTDGNAHPRSPCPDVNATVMTDQADAPPNRDSDLDAGVIVHEYGHGVSNRLTGGPTRELPRDNQERGWARAGATLGAGPHRHAGTTRQRRTRGIGAYVAFEPHERAGIRTLPYTTDLVVNPQTYGDAHRDRPPRSHGVGAIWAQMLWEMYWNLVDEQGFEPDLYERAPAATTSPCSS